MGESTAELVAELRQVSDRVADHAFLAGFNAGYEDCYRGYCGGVSDPPPVGAKEALHEYKERMGRQDSNLSDTGRQLIERHEGTCIDHVQPGWREDPEDILYIVEKRIRELKRDKESLQKKIQGGPDGRK